MKDEGSRMNVRKARALHPSSFILHPYRLSFILHPSSFLSMSSQKLLNVWILGAAQGFVSTTKNNMALAHHHHFAVDQTKAFAFALKHHLSFVVDHSILCTQILEIVHLVRHEYRADV